MIVFADPADGSAAEPLDEAARAAILAEVARLATVVKHEIRLGIGHNGVIDVAFMGGLSDIYPFRPALNLDFDFLVVAERRDENLGRWLVGLRDWVLERRRRTEIQCDVRVVRGPFKQVPARLESAHVTLHVAVFLEREYPLVTPLLRWAWRKYTCEHERDRLRIAAPPAPPDMLELLEGRGGILRTIHHLQAGAVELSEWLLPHFTEITHCVGVTDPLFTEYCLAKVATIARNHARCLQLAEPDALTNGEFADWYFERILRSDDFRRSMQIKEVVRESGYASAPHDIRDIAIRYLEQAADACRAQIRAGI